MNLPFFNDLYTVYTFFPFLVDNLFPSNDRSPAKSNKQEKAK